MDEFYKELKRKEKELETTLSAVKELLKVYTPSETSKIVERSVENNTTQINSEYDPRLSHKDKALYVLSLLKKATAEEVADKLMEIDGEFNEKKANRVATHYLSTLYRDNEIGADKLGRKYNYYIK